VLLAAAEAAAGKVNDDLLRMARVALHSTDPEVVLAGTYLARALRDPRANQSVAHVVETADSELLRVNALLALGAIGGSFAPDAIRAALRNAGSDRERAAACRALADVGEESLLADIADSDALFGAIDPTTGQFHVLLSDPYQAKEALQRCSRCAAAARSGHAKEVLPVFLEELKGETREDGVDAAVARAAQEWLVRLGPVVPSLGNMLDDSRYGNLARRIARSSGRQVIDIILEQLEESEGQERMTLALLAGTTKDPRAEAWFQQLYDESDDQESLDLALAGLDAVRRED